VGVHEFELAGIRLDSTTASGYHEAVAEQVMQDGHRQDQRPDLTQLKLMVAVAEPHGQMSARPVSSGEKADDPWYVPLIHRVRGLVGSSGMLYTGDCKMAAFETRAEIVAHHDDSLTGLPLTGETRDHVDPWLGALVDGDQDATRCWDDDRLLGGGDEFTRSLTGMVDEQPLAWSERVQIVRSVTLASSQRHALDERLHRAEAAFQKLPPEPGRGKRPYRAEGTLTEAVEEIVARYRVSGLLQVTWHKEEQVKTTYVGRGRGGPHRPTRTERTGRYVITQVPRDEAAMQAAKHRLGWRVQVTNLPPDRLTLPQGVMHYRAGYCVEGDFRMLKGKPIGISPLYVRTDEQIQGLTHLLTIALRLLTLLQMNVRDELAKEDMALVGLYEGQPTRTTTCPTAKRLLRAFGREEITRASIRLEEQCSPHRSPLSELLCTILRY